MSLVIPQAAPTADALVRLGSTRDAQAWAWLMQQHAHRLRCLAHHLLEDRARADDACQEILLAIRQSAPRFRSHGTGAEAEMAATGWVMRVATLTIYRLQRSWHRRARRERSLAGLETPAPPGAADAPTDQQRALHTALHALRDRDRLVLHLHFHAGLGYPELAQALDCTANAARVRVHRALAAVRRRLGGDGGDIQSLSVLMAHAPDPTQGLPPLPRLEQVLHAPAPAGSHLPTVLWAAASLLVVLAGCSLAIVHARAAAVPPPLANEPAALFPLPLASCPQLPVQICLTQASLDELPPLFARVLHIPFRLDLDRSTPRAFLGPSFSSMAGAPVLADLRQVVSWSDERLEVGVMPDGTLTITDHVMPELDLAPALPYYEATPGAGGSHACVLEDASGTAGANSLARQLGITIHGPVPDLGPGLVSLRAQVPAQLAIRVMALITGVDDPVFAVRLSRTVDLRFSHARLGEILAALTQATGMPFRIDSEAGMLPRLDLAPGPMHARELLDLIRQAIPGLIISPARDGMVLYRTGITTQSQPPDRDSPVTAVAPDLAARPISVMWRGASLRTIVTDLARQLGLGIAEPLPDDSAVPPVLLVLSDRPVGDVLRFLSWTTGIEIALDQTHHRLRISVADHR